jgi:2-polyprenyl-3-methyl-5-hydroxy-6-metoxy-1,4-benzoquinol methylase
MKVFEVCFNYSRLILPAINLYVYKNIKGLVKNKGNHVKLLDVGGRKSHHTININAEITITDIPRESNIQSSLHLGVNKDIINQLKVRRSNVDNYLIDNMVNTKLPKESFDIIMAIEVLEHVEEDDLFIKNVYKTLKPGGVFIMTTPNGDHVENDNPDHMRHYTKDQLTSVLKESFKEIEVLYAIRENKHYFTSLNTWSLKHPLRTIQAMTGSLINNLQSNFFNQIHKPENSRHLTAIAYK